MKSFGTLAKVGAVIAMVGFNAFVGPNTLTAGDTGAKYCEKDGSLWYCNGTCPPLGCNCECNVNCVGAGCEQS